jgi:glycosyltransferase involved in cell wall biosynthesis
MPGEMPGETAVVVSFRLGGTDGVSVEAAKWEWALAQLGIPARRVAGEILDGGRPDDVVVPGLAIGSVEEPDAPALEAALAGADLAVVENLLSLPLNLPAARVLTKALADHPRVVLRHHDLPWQRPEHAGVTELPPRLPGAVHVVINDFSRRELAERGFEAHAVHNHFDLAPPPGDRPGTRARLGVGDGDVLLLHPVRAIPRKNVPGALHLAEALVPLLPGRRVVYWLPGPPEDGYQLDPVLAEAAVDVIRAPAQPVHDAYAACDLVVFPSTWEGFGNPVVESVAHRRPIAVGRYPALDEITALGLRFLPAGDPEQVAAAVTEDFDGTGNLEIARRHFDLSLLPARLEALLP